MQETDKLVSLLDRVERLLDRFDPDLPALLPDFGTFIAFRWERRGDRGRIVPVAHPHLVDLRDLVGIDDVIEEVVRNTSQFVQGLPANNILLWGERGCGKSSVVKGLLKPFSCQGLRIIELKRWDLLSLPEILGQLRGVPFRFVLFCDDLSFDNNESEFRALKTFLDGDIEERPGNVLIYATSNRRHLMPERFRDLPGPDQEIHPEEAEGERLALSDRFGICIGFYTLDQDEYLAVIKHYAASRNLAIPEEELCDRALKWSLYSARRSGRSARQFIDDLEGRLLLNGRRIA